MREQGHIIGIASMRNKSQYECLTETATFDFFIGLNGSYVELNNKTISEQPISDCLLTKILNYVSTNKLHCLLHTKESIIPIEGKKQEPVFVVELFDIGCLLEEVTQLLDHNYNYHIWENGKSCDIYSKSASKRIALQSICEQLNVSKEDCIAFGDGFNDVELFRFCGNSVAMETAPDELKEVATYITKSAKDTGVLWALKQWRL